MSAFTVDLSLLRRQLHEAEQKLLTDCDEEAQASDEFKRIIKLIRDLDRSVSEMHEKTTI